MATNYKCAAVGCYSYNSPSTNAEIRALQTQINRFSPQFGFTPIGVDGVIGKGSLAALLWTLQAMALTNDTWSSAAQTWFGSINKPEDVFVPGVLPSLILMLTQAADAANLGLVPASTASPNTIPAATTTNAVAIRNSIQQLKPSTQASVLDTFRDMPSWLMWGLGLAAVGGGAYAFTKKRKRIAA